MAFKVERRRLKIKEYQTLRLSTGWPRLTDEMVKKALENDLFSVCVLDDKTTIGLGRVIGDGAVYYYVQDVIVLPDYQKKGVGKLLMDEIENFLAGNCHKNAFIGLMAAKGVEGFYKKYGYGVRARGASGMYKLF